MNFTIQAAFFALLGGILPAALWLWFWLKEDSAHPEPKALIVLAFFFGMLAIPFVLPLEQIAFHFLSSSVFATFVLWAGIEEVLKYIAAKISVLRNKAVDEPIDYVMYMVTIALGFAALENALFLFTPLIHGGSLLDGIVTGNLRFIGASLLHVISSASVGVFLALGHYKSQYKKNLYTVLGLSIATGLHALFNLSIINDNGSNTFTVFSVLWLSVVTLLLVLEKVKTFSPIR